MTINASYLLPVKTASCSVMGDYALKYKMTVPYSKAKKGDVVLYDFNHNGTSDHTGIIYKVSGGKIYVVEGNTSKGNNCNGGMVMKRCRTKRDVNYIVRPKYTKKVTADLVVATALAEVGVKENPKNSNKVKYNTWYYGKPVKGSKYPWCMVFVEWCFYHVKEAKKATTAKKVTTSTKTPTKAEKPSKTAEKAVKWAREIAKSKKYTYKKWSDKNKKTQQCPICHKLTGKYKGWNCIGFVSAAYFHSGLKSVECSCRGIGTSGFLTKVTLETWTKRNGKNWKLISNGGKKGGSDIPSSKLLAGDVLLCYDAKGNFHHVVLYTGGGKYIDCTNTSKNHIAERAYSNLCKKYHVTRAFRCTV